jgi:diaminopimelate decarboxylase
VSYAVRLNTGEFVRGTSRFGASANEWRALERAVAASPQPFIGYHLHHGLQRNTATDYLRIADAALALAKAWGTPLQRLNLGGGLATLSLTEVEALLERLRRKVPRETRLVFEPGRLIAEGAGFAAGRVVAVRRQGKRWKCVLDLSRECHLRWSGGKALEMGKVAVELSGPTCFEGDSLGQARLAGVPAVGEIILFGDISGYSLAWNTSFNGIAPARVSFLNRARALPSRAATENPRNETAAD